MNPTKNPIINEPQSSFRKRDRAQDGAYVPNKRRRPRKVKVSNLNDVLDKLYDLESRFPEIKKGPRQAVDLYQSNSQYRQSIDKIDSGLSGSGKLAALEQSVGNKFLVTYVPKFKGMSDVEKLHYASVLYSDSLGTLLGVGARAVAPYLRDIISHVGQSLAPKFIDWLFSHLERLQSRDKTIASHGSGTGLLSVIKPSYSIHRRVTADTVSLPYLASVIAPEKWKSLTPDNMMQALAQGFQQQAYSVVSGSDGNVIFYYLPDPDTAAGVSTDYQFCATTTTSTSNTSTGLITTPFYGSGLFNSNGASSIAKFRSTSGAFRFVPNLAALNNSGTFSLAYATDAPNLTVGQANPAVAYGDILQFPFFHSATVNGTTEMRQIHIPHDINELSLDQFATTSSSFATGYSIDMMQLLGTGLPTGVVVGTAYVVGLIDFMPGLGAIGVTVTNSTPDAPASIPCISSIIKKLPHVAQLTLDESLDLASFILSLECDQMPDVIDAVMNYSTKYKPRPRTSLMDGGGGNDIGGLSFDFVKEGAIDM